MLEFSEDNISDAIRHIDCLLLSMVRQVVRSPRFRRLEASYRNLWFLCMQVEGRADELEPVRRSSASLSFSKSKPVRLYCLPVSAEELKKDLVRADRHDAHFHKLLYTNRFDRFAAVQDVVLEDAAVHPFGLMVLDFELVRKGQQPDEGQLSPDAIEQLALIAEEAFCPLIVGASTSLFRQQNDSFRDLATIELDGLFGDQNNLDTRNWKELRRQRWARMICVALPRVCLRPAYRRKRIESLGAMFDELEDELENSARSKSTNVLWGSPCHSVASLFVRSFRDTHWFMDATGVDRDLTAIAAEPGYVPAPYLGKKKDSDEEPNFGFSRGVVAGLPAGVFSTESGSCLRYSPVEVMISEALESRLANLGFTALYAGRLSGRVAVLSCSSLIDPRLPQRGTSQVTTLMLESVFSHIMVVARIVHLLRRELWLKLGKKSDADEVQNELENWLKEKSSPSTSSVVERLRKPLCDSGTTVTVMEKAGQPGSFSCSLQLCPHHRFSSQNIALSLEPIEIKLPTAVQR